MKQQRVQRLSLIVAVIMLVGLLAACSSKNETASSPSSSSATKASATPTKDPVTLKVEIFDRGNVPAGAGPVDNNFWTQWIQKNFGDPNNIKLQFIPVPRSQEVDKLNVLMATSDAPDIVFTYDTNTIYNFIKSEALTDLGKVIEDNGPNLKKFLGNDTLSYGQFGGKQLAVPAKRALQYMHSSLIRKDWLDKLGLPVPKTTDEFYNTMKAFKEKDPGGTGGKVIPYEVSLISMDAQISPGYISPSQLIQSFEKKMSPEDFAAFPEILRPGYKDGLKFMNKLYNEGLMSHDFALDKDGKKSESDISNGFVGAFTANSGHTNLFGTDKVMDTLKKNVPTAQYVAMDAFTNEEGKHPKEIYDPIGMYLMVPKTSKHAVEAIKYMDWMSKPDVLFALENGIEGQHYTLENGFPKPILNDETKKTFYNNVDLAIVVNGKDYGSKEKNIEGVGIALPSYKDLIVQSVNFSLTDGYTKPHFDQPVDAVIKYGKTLEQNAEGIIVKSIMAKPADFEKVFGDGITEFNKIGGQEVVDGRRAAFKAIQK